MKHILTLGFAALIVLLGASLGASPARPNVQPEPMIAHAPAHEAVDLGHAAPEARVAPADPHKPPGHCGQ